MFKATRQDIWFGQGGSRAEQTGSKVLQYGREDNNGMSPRRIVEHIVRD